LHQHSHYHSTRHHLSTTPLPPRTHHVLSLLPALPLLSLFFFMIRRPPRSTLFPTRRSSDLSRLTFDRFFRNLNECFIFKLQLDSIHLEEFSILLDECILRFSQNFN